MGVARSVGQIFFISNPRCYLWSMIKILCSCPDFKEWKKYTVYLTYGLANPHLLLGMVKDYACFTRSICAYVLLSLPSMHQVPFDIFDRKYKDSWHTVMQHFRQQVEEIEDMTKSFIEQSFQKLRSAEGAFELVQNFQNIQSRESINQSIDERYKDILAQYTKELDYTSAIFHENKSLPPIYKNYPPVAGAIAWARDLYNRAKKPILRFKVRIVVSLRTGSPSARET